MVRVFGHYLSVRAVLFAMLETAAFLAIYAIVRVIVLYLVFGEIQEIYGQSLLVPLFCLTAFLTAAGCGLYNKDMFTDIRNIASRLFTVAALMYFLMAAMISAAELLFENTTNLKLYYAITLGTTAGYFMMVLFFRFSEYSRSFKGTALERRIIVLGLDDRAAKIELMNGRSRSPYTTIGFVPMGGAAPATNARDLKVISATLLEDGPALLRFALDQNVDEIVVASRERRGMPVEALMECKLAGLAVTDFSSFWERQTGQIDLDDVTPSWLIFSEGFHVSRSRNAVKRSFDIIVSTVLLIVTLPVMIAAAIAIKLDSPGPVFYHQERVGRDGHRFSVLKFRSMVNDAEHDGQARWAQSGDNRITNVGRFIRRTRIDELPQVLNVLVGDMSFVGPRPERPFFVDALKSKLAYYDVRHRVNPGITGWAQVSYPYGASDEDAKAKLAYDLYYVKNWNVFLDIVLLLQTVRIVFWGEGAR